MTLSILFLRSLWDSSSISEIRKKKFFSCFKFQMGFHLRYHEYILFKKKKTFNISGNWFPSIFIILWVVSIWIRYVKYLAQAFKHTWQIRSLFSLCTKDKWRWAVPKDKPIQIALIKHKYIPGVSRVLHVSKCDSCTII